MRHKQIAYDSAIGAHGCIWAVGGLGGMARVVVEEHTAYIGAHHTSELGWSEKSVGANQRSTRRGCEALVTLRRASRTAGDGTTLSACHVRVGDGW